MFESLVSLLTAYQLPAVFAGSFFFGDSVLLSTAYLAGQLGWSLLPIFATALLGTVLSDSLWYWAGRYAGTRLSGVSFLSRERAKLSRFAGRFFGMRPWLALILVKFLYGSRVAMILYTASRGLSFLAFTVFNTIGAVIWLMVFLPLGYLAGRGVARVAPFIDALPAAFTILIVSSIVVRILTLWMQRKK